MFVYGLKVKRTKAGRDFPFPRIYLIENKDSHYLKQLFRYALILPVQDAFKEMLKAVMVDQYKDSLLDRGAVENQLPPWHEFIDGADWTVAVPLLAKFVKKELPRFIIADDWYHGRHIKDPFPMGTYLQTLTRDFRPVCMACSRSILHQSGNCQLGQQECYESLALGVKDYFVEGLTVAQPVRNPKDPTLEPVNKDDDLCEEYP